MSFFDRLPRKEAWFGILVRTGKESKVREAIIDKEKELNLKDLVVPEPPKNRFEKDNDLNARYKNLAGYILVKFMMDIVCYNILLQIDHVYRFLGSVNIDKKGDAIF